MADTINILNDDDALELFKKTLPGASASLLQIQMSASAMKARALALIQEAQTSSTERRPALDFIGLSLRGKKIGFEKIIGMIDDFVAELKVEHETDDKKKECCAEEFDTSEDKHEVLTKSIADLESAIAESEEGITTTKAEIEALSDARQVRCRSNTAEEGTKRGIHSLECARFCCARSTLRRPLKAVVLMRIFCLDFERQVSWFDI